MRSSSKLYEVPKKGRRRRLIVSRIAPLFKLRYRIAEEASINYQSCSSCWEERTSGRRQKIPTLFVLCARRRRRRRFHQPLLICVSTCDVNLFGHRREGYAERAKKGPAISIRRRRRCHSLNKRRKRNKRNFSRQVTPKRKKKVINKERERRQTLRNEIYLFSK